jgi:DNA-binding LacI/PurR family transcriptional regulator
MAAGDTRASGAATARPTRLQDVAHRAGVSVKTVSNVVNGYTHVAAGTRDRVQEALTELAYRPNLTARNLRRGRSGLVALALPELDFPYFAELARHVVEAARDVGWTVLLDQTDGQAEREKQALDAFGSGMIDGLIMSPLASGRTQLSGPRSTPLVLLGERVFDGPADHVSIDNVVAARDAVGHLTGQGRRRIAAIGAQQARSAATARLRLRGYRAALRSADLPRDDSLVVATRTYHRADGAEAMTRLLELPEPPDAVFCFNDLLALGALRVLHDRGARVPEDIAVVGVDDIEDGRYATPSLSSVRPDKEFIAQVAVRLLLERLEAGGPEAAPPREVVAPHQLVVRESSGG